MISFTLRRVPLPCALAWLAMASLSACSSDDKPPQSDQCHQIIGSERYFTGSKECLLTLQNKVLEGYIRYGFESVTFHNTYDDAKTNYDIPSLTWIYFDPATEKKIPEPPTDKYIIYKVKFFGSITREKGLYGHMGQFSGGAVVREMMEITPAP